MPVSPRRQRRLTDDQAQLRLLVASPQPFLPALVEVDWSPAQRLAPDRPRRPRRGEGRQGRLVVPEPDATTG